MARRVKSEQEAAPAVDAERRMSWLYRFTALAPCDPPDTAEAKGRREEIARRRDRLTGTPAERLAGFEAVLADLGLLEYADRKFRSLEQRAACWRDGEPK